MSKDLWECEKQALESGYIAMSEIKKAINYLDHKISNANGKDKEDACTDNHHLEEVKSSLSRVLNQIQYGTNHI